ncbi:MULTISPECIES: hypothetical protein [unclassified Mesorhizobium]|uniref:hypothetical protein n=1 Tax=unclassified Mesorhizobium TaxID=325217 RepID=UPI00112B1D48|nr:MULTISPECIES: hypothetical protein [unclassified Mesorhizobium]TPK66288.1 hypothetical protein FJ551_09315 [Mesorhizobium sp. B2-5-1]TPM60666.1 hypothetical protein FJ962_16170 [Mesorhizobium sp. B2-1-9]TPM88003.1 hypothetical protein FJ963_03375 [Mesorhizobium sp. B2-1-4]TPN11077.1 hypothetical protein FJ971_13335 [Mesorhizobium sp. B2-1-2]UCI14716.1 hypothetical protein FJ972_07610 [Mesorhizobium sp. B2-1-1]
MLRLRAVGQFRLLDAAGVDYSPHSQKARGVIALLALSPTLSRGRTWLQNKLWSDRGSDQAAASLRQALCDIRRSLDIHANALRSDRQSVSLDARLFRTCFEPPACSDPSFSSAELFEDLDIPDWQFADWIRRHRSAVSASFDHDIDSVAKPLAPHRRNVSFTADLDPSHRARQLASKFFALTSRAVRAHVDAVFFREAGPVPQNKHPRRHDADRSVAIRAIIRDCFSINSLSVTVSDTDSGCVLWADRAQIAGHANDFDASMGFRSMVSRTADAVLDALARRPADVHEMAFRLFDSARLLLITQDKENLALADRQCAEAFEMSRRSREVLQAEIEALRKQEQIQVNR